VFRALKTKPNTSGALRERVQGPVL